MPWTVTNSFKRIRGLMKTYGRQVRRVHDEDTYHASKKRRVEAADDSEDAEANLRYAIRESSVAVAVSSPSRRNSVIFSEATQEELDDLSTPPSSPPPRLTPPPVNTRKPTFSFLKRKKSCATSTKESANGTPLTEVNSNSVRSGTDHQSNKKSQQQPPVLKQLQIDAGINVRRSCSLCGMEYVPSNAEDADLHDKFHSMNAVGIDLGKAFVKANASRWVYEAARCKEGYVVIVDRKGSPAARNQAKKVLDVVNRELSSPPIDDATLWSQVEPPKRLRKNGKKEETDRYKVFLHMKDSKCMGLCLAERIWEAQPVKMDNAATGSGGNDEHQHQSSSISVHNTFDPAIVGVSRIWTCGSARRRGIAMDLLDCVVSSFIYGLDIPKEQIAFTQPTESGTRLAGCFFGAGEPWHRSSHAGCHLPRRLNKNQHHHAATFSFFTHKHTSLSSSTLLMLEVTVSSVPQSSSQSKIVRIATPPLPSSPPSDSTSNFPAVSFTGIGRTHHRGSPSPENSDSSILSDLPGPSRFDPLSSDHVVTEKDNSYRHRQSIADTRSPADAAGALPSPPSERLSYSRSVMSEPRRLNGKSNNDDNNNNTLDVDAFTRLLLTGSAQAASNTTSRATTNPDTASDPVTRAQSDVSGVDSKPNSSTEPNTLRQIGVDDIAGMTRASTLPVMTGSNEILRSSSTRRPKPPPPRSHHGKPIKPGDSAPLSSKISERDTPNFMSVQFRTPPPANHRESLSSLGRTSSPTFSETDTADDASSLRRTPSQSKRPPTPPIARRRSQMIKQSTLDRPNRLSMPPKSLGSQLSGPLSPGIGAKTPPRPPSRRHDKAVAAESVSQPKSSLSQGELTPPVSLSMDEQASTASLSPPSRRSSVKQNPAGSTTTTTESGTLMPPPPPPPRRLRASSKGSNSSAQATALVAGIPAEKAGVDDNETNTEPPSSSNMQDILADLSRLQQEVDDLRVHYEGRRVSQ
ncbi:hypothetical protein UA08_02025 [Talaromyces atroroseus]|uniref:N-acetyltransferase domain-containing protein n=1 Tax=Talaromyces atroroseus TaxID=1441469 RepID=A0A1Q5QBA3_TALAT|nr:hypothetical protein UA08_02025 [Talaromyces atroroseus]OKL63049.1 hypothetical protein UA08_02025 [Talaromyces atroroseus]